MRISKLALVAAALWLEACSSCGGGGGDAAKLMPNYAVGIVTIRSLPELAADVGTQQLVAMNGPQAQQQLAQVTAVLGFDPTNPASMVAAGVDPAAPVSLGLTRLQGELTTPVLFIRATDPAVLTNYFVQKAPLAQIIIGPPTQVGSHTVYMGTGTSSVAATAFDKVIAIAFGNAGSQPVAALQELMAVEAGTTPSLAKEPNYQAAIAPMGAADVVGYLNVASLTQGLAGLSLGTDELRMASELRRFTSLSAAGDVQAGALSLKYFWSPAPGGMPARLLSEDASDVPVLDRIGGQPLASMRATLDLPAIWAQMSPQIPELAELREGMLQDTGLSLDTDIVGMLTGTFSVSLFRIGIPPALDVVITAGLTDPMKINRILQALQAKGLTPSSVQVGGVFVNSWAIEGLSVSMAVMGNQLVLGIGRDAAGLGRIILGQEQPSFRAQIRDPNVAARYAKGGNGAAFVNLGLLMQQIAALSAEAGAFTTATGMVDTLGMFYEVAPGGYLGEFDLRLVPGQTVANWFAVLAQAGAAQRAAPPTFPGMPPGGFPPGGFPPGVH